MTVDTDKLLRQLFDGPPVPPSADDEDDDRDDDGAHVHLFPMVPPKMIVLEDGSVRTDGWGGTLLVVWCVVATTVTLYVALEMVSAWITAERVADGLTLGVVAGGVMCATVVTSFALTAIARWGVVRWQARKERKP